MTFVSDFDTTFDWTSNESGIAIMALGAMEQHGAHLPLNTDTFGASYFAEILASQLGAMLMPPMPYGTSLEHEGFRGSISLTPELLMAFIRNMADELEKQNVKYFVIVNGHGGNFSMGPAVRDINRKDRKIKLLIANYYQFAKWNTNQPEIHAGEGETSMMMAIESRLVGKNKIDQNPSLYKKPFSQSDLNHFGMGRMTRSGIWGEASAASLARGKRMVAEVKKNMLAFVLERISRWEEDRRYGGPGLVVTRDFKKDDIPLGMKLKSLANWNQLESDWEMLLASSIGGNFVAIHNGIACGTATTVNYEKKFSWIGMVLVDPSIRRAGVGTMLLEQAIQFAKKLGTVRLDATPAGKKLYDTLGFKDEFTLSRMQCFHFDQKLEIPKNIVKIKKADLEKIIYHDQSIFGAKRKSVLQHLFKTAPNYAFVLKKGSKIEGFCFGRHGENFEQIGPIIADNKEQAIALTNAALNQCKTNDIIIDVLDQQKDFVAYLKTIGFHLQRPFIRMYLGKHTHKGKPKQQFAITGPELG